MDTARFIDDLTRIPDTLATLESVVARGLPGLQNLPDAHRILVIGMGSSAYAAGTVAREARMRGVNVTVELASATLLPPPADDLLVIAISASGSSAEVLTAAERYRGDRLVAITNIPDSPLAALAHLVLPLLAGQEVSGVACRTFRHTLVVLGAVLNRYGAGIGLPVLAAAEASQYLLDSRSDWIEPVSQALLGPSGTFVLAPADRLSSAQQAALMIREVPRRPGYASETGDWSHVDVYLTKTLDYRALLFAGSAWDEQAIGWMRERGSVLVTVGAEHPFAVCSVRYPGEADRMTAALTEVLVAELVAAEWQQRDPEYGWSSKSVG